MSREPASYFAELCCELVKEVSAVFMCVLWRLSVHFRIVLPENAG